MKRVLLVSETPVAGTICRFAEALNESGEFRCLPFVVRGYKTPSFDLSHGAMSSFENWGEMLAEEAAKADAIVLHNVASPKLIEIVATERRSGIPFAYHFHSPPFEPPLFAHDFLTATEFTRVFCVAQGYARFCEGSFPIANIIPDISLFKSVKRRDAVFVGHLRTTSARWSRKIPEGFAAELGSALSKDAVGVFTTERLFGAESVPHRIFIQALQGFSYVVDDVCSGLFHQISLEALKSGCIVFSAADEFSVMSFCEAAECPVPPFEFVESPDMISDSIRTYTKKPSVLAARRSNALNFSENFLSEARLRQIFVRRFKEALRLG